jgi:hypothetical protein
MRIRELEDELESIRLKQPPRLGPVAPVIEPCYGFFLRWGWSCQLCWRVGRTFTRWGGRRAAFHHMRRHGRI